MQFGVLRGSYCNPLLDSYKVYTVSYNVNYNEPESDRLDKYLAPWLPAQKGGHEIHENL